MTAARKSRKWTIPGDVLSRIASDVGAGISVEDSSLLYDDEMKDFRALILKEWDAWKESNPDHELHVPEDLPSAHTPMAEDDEE